MDLEGTAKVITLLAASIGSIGLIYTRGVRPVFSGMRELLDIARWVQFQLDTDTKENLLGSIQVVTDRVEKIDHKVDSLDTMWTEFATQQQQSQEALKQQIEQIKTYTVLRGPRKVRTRQTD